ncbi:MAG TPA: penicillin acylase family protein [Steroidobacteraceae bacterium]|nr:penicillin acylase family protein [Steroidobacteraceae bacterium]
MRFLVLAVLSAYCSVGAAGTDTAEIARWHQHADHVRIVRDNWGIAHIYGKSDADAVFGMIYAQAEDDFGRIERNYLNGLGALARAEGESAIYSDLRQRLFVNPERLRRSYRSSPAWLKALMQAWSDGLNYFLSKHPAVAPRVIRHFEPWMALSFTEGSIGGDIEGIDLDKLQQFYAPRARAPVARLGRAAAPPPAADAADAAPGGSNGFAIAPSRSASGHALLWINPHTSYYFRSELQMVSEQGLNVYGAVTWGQLFVYQGFNSHNGWMHTSYGGDAVDEYTETIVKKQGALYYRYGHALRKLRVSEIDVAFKQGAGVAHRKFTVYRTHHGPIIRADDAPPGAGTSAERSDARRGDARRGDARWIAIKLLQDPVRALAQSYSRTKTTDYTSFRKIQDMRTDTSNSTVYADVNGTIAYFHGNFIPRRDPKFDYRHPVDGSNPATEWRGPHALDETITLLNPVNGWIQNTNNWPFSAAGAASPKREDYPVYMWIRGENPRGIHAVEVLHDIHDVTLDGLIAAAYDSHLTAFDVLLPPLFDDYDRLAADDSRRAGLKEPVAALRTWDRRTAADSVPTALAIFWGQELVDRKRSEARDADQPTYDYLVGHLTEAERIDALAAAVAKLQRDFGRWQTPWGDINRYQRLTDDIVQPFDDAKSSLPVGFAPSAWGALASFVGAYPRKTKKIYGSEGNSFVAAVEFGPTIHAKAIMSGGASGDPASPHFADQAQMFVQGQFRDVLFSREDVAAHAERRYHP